MIDHLDTRLIEREVPLELLRQLENDSVLGCNGRLFIKVGQEAWTPAEVISQTFTNGYLYDFIPDKGSKGALMYDKYLVQFPVIPVRFIFGELPVGAHRRNHQVLYPARQRGELSPPRFTRSVPWTTS